MLGPLASTARHHVYPWVRRGGIDLPTEAWYAEGSIDIAALEGASSDNPLWAEIKEGLLAACAMDGWGTGAAEIDAGEVIDVPAEESAPQKKTAPPRRRRPRAKKAPQ
jgi:hypothetical protein